MSELNLYSEDARQIILKYYNRDEKSFAEDVKTIREWMKTQNHLPEILDDRRIEAFLALNKCSLEKTKKKIDMYYTIRHLIPEFYINPKSERFQKALDMMYYVFVPKLTPDLYRISIFKVDKNVEELHPVMSMAITLNATEIRLIEEITYGNIVIVDLINFNLGHMRKYTPVLVKKYYTVIQKVFSAKLQALHFINVPTYADAFVSLVKSVVKPKIADRIFSHKTLDTLYESIPKELLPKDYGGDQLSLQELQELMRKKFIKYQDRFDRLETLKVNESLRPEELKNDELLGFYGNFKKLDVD